ncbi:hypothetical protein YC2023_110215 [Brassica napus]
MIENGLEFLDLWCDSTMVEYEELAEQSQIKQKLEVETKSLNKVTVLMLHQRRHNGDVEFEKVMHHEIERAVANDRSSALKECRVSRWLEEKEMESETRLLTELTYDLDRSNT